MGSDPQEGAFRRVTSREKTSPKTWRWQQHAPWTDQLPAGAVVNVSLDAYAWSYFGNYQTKLHRTFRPKDWRRSISRARDLAAQAGKAVGILGRRGGAVRCLDHNVRDLPHAQRVQALDLLEVHRSRYMKTADRYGALNDHCVDHDAL